MQGIVIANIIEHRYLFWDSHLSWETCGYLFQAWFPCILSWSSLKPLVLWCLSSSTMTLSSLYLWKLTFVCCPEGSWMLWALLWLVISTTSLRKTCCMRCVRSVWWTIFLWLPLTSFSRRTSSMSCWCQVGVSAQWWRNCGRSQESLWLWVGP